MLAMNELTDRIGPAAVGPVNRMMRERGANVFNGSTVYGCSIASRRAGSLISLAAAARDPDRAACVFTR